MRPCCWCRCRLGGTRRILPPEMCRRRTMSCLLPLGRLGCCSSSGGRAGRRRGACCYCRCCSPWLWHWLDLLCASWRRWRCRWRRHGADVATRKKEINAPLPTGIGTPSPGRIHCKYFALLHPLHVDGFGLTEQNVPGATSHTGRST